MSVQMLERKKFVAYFDESFSSGERAVIVDESFFSRENGYRDEEILEVLGLEVDEAKRIAGRRHRVWRIA